ncbi:hypothetical protein CTAYLR_004671 [Chrysophaeum taylorii]|uniref:Glycosyltransferase family 92 protein n=1 Tax=Chrysophaeum taylorii TaxID=2483200 RepID=A0AAD7U865_9STRA|nr:hypothetical protein CTAYLR_004671 [Chrysophaeum taylorii]
MPWRLYDAFVLPQEGCRLATFVAQYEGGCEEMEGVLSDAARDAGAPNATAWFGEAVAGRDECAVCVLGSWEKRNAPVFEAARKRRLEARGGPTRKLECVFDDGTVVASRPTRETFHRRASTLVFECVVPPHLRDAACSDTLGVRIVDGRRAHPRVPLCGFFGIRASTMAACAWTSANEYLDRDGVRRQPTSVRGLREWLAAHLAFGVEAFVVFDDDARWTDPRRSKLWPAVEPLAAVGRAALVPWPWRACGARGDGPWVSVRGGQRSALSIQSFWGRPSQYAAQNACHRRLKSVKWIAHLDVDEFAVPASSLPAAVAPYEARSDVSSLALPHVFYGRCDTGKGDSLLLFSGSRECAGKAQPSRTKQIAKGTAVNL